MMTGIAALMMSGCGDGMGCCSGVEYRDINGNVQKYLTTDIIYTNSYDNRSIVLQDTLAREAGACRVVGGEILYYVGSKTIVNCMTKFN